MKRGKYDGERAPGVGGAGNGEERLGDEIRKVVEEVGEINSKRTEKECDVEGREGKITGRHAKSGFHYYAYQVLVVVALERCGLSIQRKDRRKQL